MSLALANYVTRERTNAVYIGVEKEKEISSFGVKQANKALAKKKKCLKKENLCQGFFAAFFCYILLLLLLGVR